MNEKLSKGYWMPVLHSHLPFVKHPEYDYFLEEHWLFEAISETYVPLLIKMKKMVENKIDFRLTMSVTPPLAEMLSDSYLIDLYVKHLDKLIELTKKENQRLKNDRENLLIAMFYYKRIEEIKAFFTNYLDYSVLNGYKKFKESGHLELITCGATHGYLPLLRVNPNTVVAQVELGVSTHVKHFGEEPNGIWLPECAYYEGVDEVLRQNGIKYFLMETHGVNEGKPTPKYGVHAPVYTLNGVAAFARDPLSSQSVWSSEVGYPGNALYRDFYSDIGFDLDLSYIGPYISPDGQRVFTGLKYRKITGKTEQKELYDPTAAFMKTKEHARDFAVGRTEHIMELVGSMDRPPLIVSPYDAELYGHWWFEGIEFLYNVFDEIDDQKVIKPITPTEYLKAYPENQTVAPRPSSWGKNGTYEVWLNKDNDWVYKHLHYMARALEELADEYYYMDESDDDSKFKARVLNQLARELLLAQSSDWPFLITQGTATEYSTKRLKEHCYNFIKLLTDLKSNTLDASYVEWLETKNSIFSDIDFRLYSNHRNA